MGFYLSPLVDVNEIDLTTTIPAVSTSIGVIVLRNTYKGEEYKQLFFTNIDEVIDAVGMPITDLVGDGTSTTTNNCYEDILSAAGFLKYGNKLYATIVRPDNATFAGTRVTSGAQATFTAFTASDAYKMSDISSKDMDEFADEVTVINTYIAEIVAPWRGASGNKIRVATLDYATQNMMLSGGYSTWTTYSVLSQIDSRLESADEFLIVVQEQSQDTAAWTTVETWNVSTTETSTDDEGASKFAENAINGSSDYIRIAFSAVAKNSNVTTSTDEWQTFGGGIDYDGDSVTDSNIEDALDLYANAEEVDVNIFIDSNKSENVKAYMAQTICESRLDAIAILDCPKDSVINNTGSETTDLRDWRRGTGSYQVTNINFSSSYSAVYGNWLNVYDRWNQRYRWIPASGYVAGIFAKTDDVSDPWFAPAGFNRAILNNVRKLAWNPTQGNRDILYMNGINPIVSFAGIGKTIFGQKTMLDKNSAFNRINVRRLFMVMEKAISTASKYFLFEPNDAFTRIQIKNMIDPYLRDVKARRGIYDYLVVCDESNNTAERIDRNELWCDIYVKPTRASEYIVLNFIATKTGADFSEISALRAG